jgi:hypothetical protein
LAKKGETLKKVTLTNEGDVEFWDEPGGADKVDPPPT